MTENLQLLKWYHEMGVEEIIDNLPRILQKPTKTKIIPKISGNNIVQRARKLADSANNLEELKNAIENFEGLSIKKTAARTVFADGISSSEIMLIGEAPGANEDIEGIPFCGQSGQLMDKMFSFAGFYRDKNLYITNSIFWRPPANRKPTPEENEICLPFVEKHIALINPKLLVLVGATSAQTLLKTEDAITEMRKQKYNYSNQYLLKPIPVLVMFHPSYLLRQPSQKKHAWNDILKIKKYLASL